MSMQFNISAQNIINERLLLPIWTFLETSTHKNVCKAYFTDAHTTKCVSQFNILVQASHICVISWHKIVLFVACAAKYSSIFWCKRRTCTHCVISRHKIVLFDACAAKCSSIFWCKLFLYTFLWDFVTKNNHIRRSRRKIWLFLVTKSHKSVYGTYNRVLRSGTSAFWIRMSLR